VGATFELMMDLDEILYEGDDIEGDLDFILINPIDSTIPKWWTFKLLRWVQLLNQLVNLNEILYGCDEVEDDLDSIVLTLVASTIPKWRLNF
jgi:hypothetical protein